jgi:hypothetical protein
VLISVVTLGTEPTGVTTSPITDGGRSFLFPDGAVGAILFSVSAQLFCGCGQYDSLTLAGTSVTTEGGIGKPFDPSTTLRMVSLPNHKLRIPL